MNSVMLSLAIQILLVIFEPYKWHSPLCASILKVIRW